MLQFHKIVLASHNASKLKEFAALMRPLDIDVVPIAQYSLEEPEETGLTFADNAILKARHALALTKLPSLADDSGLVIPSLGGAPGIFSSRWAGKDQDYLAASEKLHDMIQAQPSPDPAAYLICVLAFITPEGKHLTFEGRIEGTIVWPPRGENKFGYDIVFQPKGYAQTFSEMGPSAKNRISHRARAFSSFVEYLNTQKPVA